VLEARVHLVDGFVCSGKKIMKVLGWPGARWKYGEIWKDDEEMVLSQSIMFWGGREAKEKGCCHIMYTLCG
jgi:hypothetical protein